MMSQAAKVYGAEHLSVTIACALQCHCYVIAIPFGGETSLLSLACSGGIVGLLSGGIISVYWSRVVGRMIMRC